MVKQSISIFFLINIFTTILSNLNFIKRPAHKKLLNYLKNEENYSYNIAKSLTMSQGNVTHHLNELEKIGLINSRIENKLKNRKVKIFTINNEKKTEIEDFINIK